MTKKEKTDLFERLNVSIRRIWLAGLGALAEAEKRGDEIFESLIEKGESYEETLQKPLDEATASFRESVSTARTKASSALQDLEGIVDRQVAAAMKRLGLASRAEVESLRREVQRLKTARAPKKKTAKK